MSQSQPPNRRHPLEAGPQRPAPPPAGPDTPPRQRVLLAGAAARPLVVLALIAINVAVFAVGFLLPNVGDWLFLNGASRAHEVLVQGQYYRLFTAMFLHAGPIHIFFNMYALYLFGSILEPLFGHRRFAIIYLLGGLTGSALSVILGDPHPPLAQAVFAGASVGASGAVFAIFGAEMVFIYRHRDLLGAQGRMQLRNLLLMLGMNLLIGVASAAPGAAVRIDNWAHLGGLAGGMILAWFISPILTLQMHPDHPGEILGVDTNPLNKKYWVVSVFATVLVVLVFVGVFLAHR